MKKFFAILMSALMILSCAAMMTVTSSAAPAEYTPEEAAKLTSFPEDTFKSYFQNPNQTEVVFNEDGSITFKGTWEADTTPLDPFVTFNYVMFLRRCVDKRLENVPTANDEYGAIAMKVKMDASIAGNFCLFLATGEETSISATTATYTPDYDAEGTGDFEYLIFDVEGFTDGIFNVMRLDWVNDLPSGSEDNVGASMTLYEICLYKDYDEALAACGIEVPTKPAESETEEAPESEKTSDSAAESASAAGSSAESAADDSKADEKDEEKKGGCGAVVISASALTVVMAASAAVVLKKKED